MIRHTAVIQKEERALTVSIGPAGNEPLNQTWDEESGEHLPDRSLVPLILDGRAMLDGEDVSGDYEERGWWRVEADGSETQVTASLPGHTLWPTGYPLGLKLTGNVAAGGTVKYVLRVKARGVPGMGFVSLRTNTGASAKPSVELDCPSGVAWDPFTTDRDTLVITPTVRSRGKTTAVQWKKVVNGVRRVINIADPADAEIKGVGLTTHALTLDRRVMGSRVTLVCELYVTKAGETPTLVDEKAVTVTRRIPPYREGIKADAYFGGDDSTVRAEAVVSKEPGGVIADPSAELVLGWYDGSTKAGEGNWHDFAVKGKEKADIGLEVTDRGPWCLAVDGDGAYLTDGDGALLLIR